MKPAALLALLVGLSLIAPSSLCAQSTGNDLESRIQSTLDAARLDHGLMGVAVSIRTPTLGIKSFAAGIATEGVPVDTSRAFIFASYTKVPTAIAIMQLADEGLLTLSDSVGAYLAPIPHVEGSVTIRELLEHRSTVTNYFWSAYSVAMAHPDTVFDTRQMLIDHLPPSHDSQGRFRYCDSNFQVLGLIAEAIRGIDGRTLLQERVFGPSGAVGAQLAPIGLQPEEWNGGWEQTSSGLTDVGSVDPTGLLSVGGFAGGAVGTTADMLRILEALFAGKLVSDASLTAMQTGSAANENYGLGMMRREVDGVHLYGHTGGMLHVTQNYFAPATGIGVSLAINHEGGPSEDLFDEIYRLVRDAATVSGTRAEAGVPGPAIGLTGYPNPATGTVQLGVSMPDASPVTVTAYNVIGQRMGSLFNGVLMPGEHAIRWDVTAYPAGLYLVRAVSGARSATLRIFRN